MPYTFRNILIGLALAVDLVHAHGLQIKSRVLLVGYGTHAITSMVPKGRRTRELLVATKDNGLENLNVRRPHVEFEVDRWTLPVSPESFAGFEQFEVFDEITQRWLPVRLRLVPRRDLMRVARALDEGELVDEAEILRELDAGQTVCESRFLPKAKFLVLLESTAD